MRVKVLESKIKGMRSDIQEIPPPFPNTYGSFFPNLHKYHTHSVGMGVLMGVGVGISSDTHGFTHDNP